MRLETLQGEFSNAWPGREDALKCSRKGRDVPHAPEQCGEQPTSSSPTKANRFVENNPPHPLKFFRRFLDPLEKRRCVFQPYFQIRLECKSPVEMRHATL
jgi:hypothetical protein